MGDERKGPLEFFLGVMRTGPWIRTPLPSSAASPSNGKCTEPLRHVPLDETKTNFLLTARYPLLSYGREFLPLLRDDTSTPLLIEELFSPVELVEEVIALAVCDARARGVEISFLPKWPLPETIKSDCRWVRQTLSHTLNTFVSSSDAGKIVTKLSFQPRRQQLTFSLQVSKLRLSETEWESLLVPFHATEVDATASTLLACRVGILLCQQSILSLGGKFELKKGKGKGATLTFAVPTGAVTAVLEDSRRKGPVKSAAISPE